MLLVLSLTFLPSARGITNVPCPTFKIVCLEAEKCEGANIKLKDPAIGRGAEGDTHLQVVRFSRDNYQRSALYHLLSVVC